jgi:hypothetical protein
VANFGCIEFLLTVTVIDGKTNTVTNNITCREKECLNLSEMNDVLEILKIAKSKDVREAELQDPC